MTAGWWRKNPEISSPMCSRKYTDQESIRDVFRLSDHTSYMAADDIETSGSILRMLTEDELRDINMLASYTRSIERTI